MFICICFAGAAPLPIDPMWSTDSFRKAFTASYGVDSRIEPKLSPEEKEQLDQGVSKVYGAIPYADEKAEEAIKTIIEWIGENPNREGLKGTPRRLVKAFKEYFQGYSQEPKIFLSKT